MRAARSGRRTTSGSRLRTSRASRRSWLQCSVRPFLSAEWRHLLMLDYAVEPDLLRPYVPRGTELDAWNGTCSVSVVGFLMLNTRVLGVPVSLHRYNEPYRSMPMRRSVDATDGALRAGSEVSYGWRYQGHWNSLRGTVSGAPRRPAPSLGARVHHRALLGLHGATRWGVHRVPRRARPLAGLVGA